MRHDLRHPPVDARQRTARHSATVLPSAAQEHRELGPARARRRRAAPSSPAVGLPSSEESSQHSAGPTVVLVTVLWFFWGVVRGAHLGVRMVGHRSQHRSHRLLLMSPPRAQTALPSPPRGSVIAMQRHVDHWGSNKGKRALRAVTLESERLLLSLLLLLSLSLSL